MPGHFVTDDSLRAQLNRPWPGPALAVGVAGGVEQLLADGVGEPRLECVGRPTTLAHQQQPDIGMVQAPEDVRRLSRAESRTKATTFVR